MNILNIIFPRRCVGCGKIGRYICSACQTTVTHLDRLKCPECGKSAISGMTHPGCRTRYTLDGLTSFFRYDGVVRKAIKTLKYRLVTDLTRELVSLVPPVNPLELVLPRQPIFVPIPLHPSRQRERGFNQTEVLSRALGSRWGIAVRTDILKRVKQTTPQVVMHSREDRLKNMKDVFTVSITAGNLKNIPIVLFDDVFTTGATLRVAGNTLKRAGAKFVWALTIAQ